MFKNVIEDQKISIFIRSQQAEAGPPLGTVLGNMGLNSTKFCKEFNEYTKELPVYFYLQVEVSVLEDKSFGIKVKLPNIGFILGLLKREKPFKKGGKEYIEHVVSLKDVIEVTLFKMPKRPLRETLPMVVGTILSAGLRIENYVSKD